MQLWKSFEFERDVSIGDSTSTDPRVGFAFVQGHWVVGDSGVFKTVFEFGLAVKTPIIVKKSTEIICALLYISFVNIELYIFI